VLLFGVHRWWSTKRAELLRLVNQHSLQHDSLYVYSLQQLRANISALQALKSIDKIFFACKANHHLDMLKTMHAAGLGFECVSIQELKFIHALFPGLARDRLLFTPNFAGKLEYEEAYFYTEQVNLDNVYPLEAWPEVFKGKSVLLRVDPGEGLGYHEKMQTGGVKSKFGVSVEQMLAAVPKMKELNIRVVGLHVHKGSGIHVSAVWAKTAEFLCQFLPLFPDLKYLDLGGGLGIQYRDTDPPLDLQALDASVAALRASLPDGAGQRLQLWLEPGRFLAAQSGVLLAKVTQLKTKPGRSFVGMSTGMNSLIRPALYEAHHDIVNLSRLPEHVQAAGEAGRIYLNTLDPRTHSLVDVVGPICESGDVLGFARSLPSETAEGDVLLVDAVGAYGRVMSSEYNLRPPAHGQQLRD
jgi:diaminopimelate decarboxylase/aspartate kinase